MLDTVRNQFFINESDIYSVIIGSRLKSAEKFKHWVPSQLLPSIRYKGYYKLFDNLNNYMFKIENETDLHYKVVQYIKNILSTNNINSKSW